MNQKNTLFPLILLLLFSLGCNYPIEKKKNPDTLKSSETHAYELSNIMHLEDGMLVLSPSKSDVCIIPKSESEKLETGKFLNSLSDLKLLPALYFSPDSMLPQNVKGKVYRVSQRASVSYKYDSINSGECEFLYFKSFVNKKSIVGTEPFFLRYNLYCYFESEYNPSMSQFYEQTAGRMVLKDIDKEYIEIVKRNIDSLMSLYPAPDGDAYWYNHLKNFKSKCEKNDDWIYFPESLKQCNWHLKSGNLFKDIFTENQYTHILNYIDSAEHPLFLIVIDDNSE